MSLVKLLATVLLSAAALPGDGASVNDQAPVMAGGLLDDRYQERGYRWHKAGSQSVQFGIPDSDDRALRVDCDRNRLEIMVPIATTKTDGALIEVSLQGSGGYEGVIASLGDGPNVVVSLQLHDPIVAQLLGAPRLTIQAGGSAYSVPLSGGTVLLNALAAGCR